MGKGAPCVACQSPELGPEPGPGFTRGATGLPILATPVDHLIQTAEAHRAALQHSLAQQQQTDVELTYT